MLTRRDLFQRLAGAVIGVAVAPAAVKAAGLVFHPKAFQMVMEPLRFGPPVIARMPPVIVRMAADGHIYRIDWPDPMPVRVVNAWVTTESC